MNYVVLRRALGGGALAMLAWGLAVAGVPGAAQAQQRPNFSRVLPIDHGHFIRSAEAFRHWDKEGAVPAFCSRCHTAEGLPRFIATGQTVEERPSVSLDCSTCHDDLIAFSRITAAAVPFPSGATLSLAEIDSKRGADSNLCLNCHQGRESTASVDKLIADAGPDERPESLRFLNVHYFAAGASLFGTEAKGAYEYAGQTYAGRNPHVERADVCTECHTPHQTGVRLEQCSACHRDVSSAADLANIRMTKVDFDGDGDVSEGLVHEIDAMREAVLAAMQAYAARTEGVDPITYNGVAYPYFFNEAGEPYATWTPRLLRAAYNYQYASKDPGGYAHNGPYILQVLYDSLSDIGGDTAGKTRP